jgi:hypothetical protein
MSSSGSFFAKPLGRLVPWMIVGGTLLLLPTAALLGWAIAQRSTASPLPLDLLQASATDANENFAIATGMVSTDSEGIYILDYATGELNCFVMYARNGQFGAHFSTNVTQFLPRQNAKGQRYLMVTGATDLPGITGGAPQPSGCVYVLDASTGAFAAFGVPFNRAMMNGLQPQQGLLVPMAQGMVRTVPNRNNVRGVQQPNARNNQDDGLNNANNQDDNQGKQANQGNKPAANRNAGQGEKKP